MPIPGCDYVGNDWAYCVYCGCFRPRTALGPDEDHGLLGCLNREWCMREAERRAALYEEVAAEFVTDTPWGEIEQVGDLYFIRHRAIAAQSYRDNAKDINKRRAAKRNKNKPTGTRVCDCGKDISGMRPQAKYCSPRCQKRVAARKK